MYREQPSPHTGAGNQYGFPRSRTGAEAEAKRRGVLRTLLARVRIAAFLASRACPQTDQGIVATDSRFLRIGLLSGSIHRPFPFRQRRYYRAGCKGDKMKQNSLTAFLLLLMTSGACALDAKTASDAQIRHAIVQASRETYYRTGHPCACPDDAARNGSRSGRRSAYSRPGAAAPLCYASDVTDSDVAQYRAHVR